MKLFMMVGDREAWGIIPSFLDPLDDNHSAKERFAEHYIGGWNPIKGFIFDNGGNKRPMCLRYPGDPPMHALSAIQYGDETLIVFEGEWVMILQRDGTHEIARMD